jgi:hypothetical protein
MVKKLQGYQRGLVLAKDKLAVWRTILKSSRSDSDTVNYQLIKIFRPVNPLARPNKVGADIVAEYLFRRLSVLLVHGEEEQREHQPHHQKRRRAVADNTPREYVHGDSDNGGGAEAYELPGSEI